MAYVNIDLGAKITAYNQNASDWGYDFSRSCAFVCGAMVINVRPDTLARSGIEHYPADWERIAAYSGLELVLSNSSSMEAVLDILKAGYPVIVESSSNPHWVVVYAYEGLDTAIVSTNFICLDPADGNSARLNKSYKYTGVRRHRYYK